MALNTSDSVVAGIGSVLYLLIKDLNFELLFCYKMPIGQKKKRKLENAWLKVLESLLSVCARISILAD